jgi:undecaprenyl-diphosphatase
MAAPLSDYRWAWDESLFHAINSLEIGWLDRCWVVLSELPFALTVLTVLAVAFAWRRRTQLVWAIGSVLLTIGLCDSFGSRVLKPAFGRMRPAFALDPSQVRVLAHASKSGSMPSLHAANAFAVAVTVAFLWPRAGLALLPVAILISLSRVGVGVHWPSDLLAGTFYGLLVGVLVGGLTRWLRLRGRLATEG